MGAVAFKNQKNSSGVSPDDNARKQDRISCSVPGQNLEKEIKQISPE